jgi:hypothetical protein
VVTEKDKSMEKIIAFKPHIIGFRTMNDWTADELSAFLLACSRAYNVFDALNNFNQRNVTLKFYEDMIESIEPLLSQSKEGSIYLELYKQWLKMYRQHFSNVSSPLKASLETPPSPPPNLLIDIQGFPNSIGFLYSHSQQFHSLRIHRIKMASPGGISFSGLADVMKELREFFKDILYRNKQEKKIGQLEIIEKYISVLLSVDKLSDTQKKLLDELPALCRILDESVSQIQQLENRNLLADIPKNVDYVADS